MSKYTTQLRNIVENCTYDNYELSTSDRIEQSRSFIFDFDYPLWNEAYKKTLETKIIKHFYTKEIGFETIGLWKFYLEETLNLIMPYYNDLYATTVKDYDYLTNVDNTETFTNSKKTSGNSEITGNDTNNKTSNTTQDYTGNGTQGNTENTTSKTLSSDLPQASYSGVDYATTLNDITDSKNNTSEINSTSNTTAINTDSETATKHITNTDNNTTTETSTRQHKGNTGSKSFTELLVEYRESLLNIDRLVIDELKDLFMMIF
jgi:hypothetical protein